MPKKHGFTCKVLFAWDSTGKYIDPNNQSGVIGWNHLNDADLMLIGTRFRRPSEEDAKHITAFLNAGKPVIGIRTSTHAFNGNGSFGGKISNGQFGPLVMGEGWVNHHGKHKGEGARGIIEVKNAAHPILKGVTDVFGPSDVYGIRRLTDKDTILMLRQLQKHWSQILLLLIPQMTRCNLWHGYTHTLHPMVKLAQLFALLWGLRLIWSVRTSGVCLLMRLSSLPD